MGCKGHGLVEEDGHIRHKGKGKWRVFKVGWSVGGFIVNIEREFVAFYLGFLGAGVDATTLWRWRERG